MCLCVCGVGSCCAGGLPDLLLWRAADRCAKLVEVKGPRDRLSHQQRFWLAHMSNNTLQVRLAHFMRMRYMSPLAEQGGATCCSIPFTWRYPRVQCVWRSAVRFGVWVCMPSVVSKWLETQPSAALRGWHANYCSICIITHNTLEGCTPVHPALLLPPPAIAHRPVACTGCLMQPTLDMQHLCDVGAA